MTEYLISNYGSNSDPTEWSYIASDGTVTLSSGDTVKLTADLGSPSSPLTSIALITIPEGVTFDGQGYKIYLDVVDHNGCFYLYGGIIQNLGLDCTSGSTVADNCGYLGTGSTRGGYVYNCHSNGNVTGSCSGGLIGTTSHKDLSTTITVERCTWIGSLTGGNGCGGIIGYLSDSGDPALSHTIVNECYAIVTSVSGNYHGGITGIAFSTNTLTYNNCYSIFNSPGNTTTCGIVGFYSGGSVGSAVITNCYAQGYDIPLIQSANSSFSSVTTVNNSIASTILYGSGTLGTDNNNSTDLTTIQGKLSGSASSWDTEYWTIGTDSNYPTLDQFHLGPWTNYTNYNDVATLTSPYTSGGSRVSGSYSGAGGDPHINPIYGNPYTLPKTENTFLLVDNNVSYDRLVIKGKCWYLPKSQYQDALVRAQDRNNTKYNKLKDLFENGTFFKYIKIEYKGKEVIVDMDDLSLKKNGGKAALYNGSLEDSESTRFKYGDMINVNGITGSDKGLYTATSTKVTHDKSYKTIERTVEINTLDTKLILTLSRDRKNISRRNSIKLFLQGDKGKYSGTLIRKDVNEVDF